MDADPFHEESGIVASNHDAPQHRPRPLPLFLALLRSETATSPDRFAAALRGLRAYQRAKRNARAEPMPALLNEGRVTLRDFGGTGRPVVFIPSLINPPHVLDLAENNSLLRWLATRGVHPLLIDWGTPTPEEREVTVAGHVERYLLPLLRGLGEPIGLAGYCLGGTMAIGAACVHPVTSLTLIATPWHFAGFPPQARLDLVSLWEQAEPLTRELGLLPMEVLQTSFWRLDPARTISKFERFSNLDPSSDDAAAFVELEDWANDGPPLTAAAGRELLIDLFGHDRTGEGRWTIEGETVDPGAIRCPVLNIASSTDRIVPASSAPTIGDIRRLALGHVGMVVGSKAKEALWRPLARWLSHTHKRW